MRAGREVEGLKWEGKWIRVNERLGGRRREEFNMAVRVWKTASGRCSCECPVVCLGVM